MKAKRKFIAIWIVLFLSAISLVNVNANEINTIEEEEDSISVEIGNIASDGTIFTENLQISEEEMMEFQKAFSGIVENIKEINDIGSLIKLIEKFLGGNSILSGKISKILTGLKLVKNRAFVISSGAGLDLNPLGRISFKIRKRIGIWHYNSNSLSPGNTFIVQPLKFKIKSLEGSQFGFMSRFTGFYVSFSRGFLKESHTFFMGMARHINGIQLSTKI